ncbi:GTPase-activating protein CdGAPr isoform X2 [Anthonomus grandis grandis]|uniref:GTPase-activating protein CdGAPr isoform X2 n=1 Tax=Anthonomus grandis grandis TaxID=2921223 RepID=UPI0021660F3B|nr:GTPase-activating protein CdGAPr isoform X2 [Anthonomus grandis grandis]
MLEIVLPGKNGPLGVFTSGVRYKTLCSEPNAVPPSEMQISEAAGGAPQPGAEPCRFPKLEECAHFHYERVQLPGTMQVALQTSMDQSLHSQHTNEDEETEWFMVQVTSGEECWLVQRNFENFKMLDEQVHQCIFDRKISQLTDLSKMSANEEELEEKLAYYLERFSQIADNSVNCGPVLNWLQMDNKGHRLLVPSEESRSINTPAVAAAYSVRRYVSQARDELNLEVGDMISVIDMASPGESMWWRGKRGFQVGFFPQHCVHIIGDKVPRNMPLPPPVVGPSRRRLKQSGILKERVFGCDLGEHLLNSGKDVPTVLKSCAEFIEANGIVDGIYRLSGVTSNIQKLRNAFDEDRVPDLHTEDILKDIHSVASLLKMYFRELPNPLCTYQLYQSFVNAVQGCSTAIRNSETDHERLLKMREAVQKLPPPHYRTLDYLMRHLARVANHSSSTGMTTRNLAIVWAPNLLRCEALEVGGVAALQGVGVQAVVTEFLICYADLIFCDHLPSVDQSELAEKENLLAKKCRPNSLAISTPTKLITLEEARNKQHLTNKTEECNYIEVGGGPSNLPKKYHTIIDLPPGVRKRGHTKRSPLGWRMFFSRSSRNATQGTISKSRISTPITINDKSVTESDLTDKRIKLRSVKSAESLTSGHSEPASTEDVLGPLHSMNKPPGHNRSVSHDSYFDTLQSSQANSEASLLDLSEIHLNFDLEESEMRIFSEDESLVSSPRLQKDMVQRRILTRTRPEEFIGGGSTAANSVNPSPKKQPRVVLSPEAMSRKRTRLEDQLSDIQYIDCNTPENVVNTTAVVHAIPPSPEDGGPKNKSPRNSDILDTKRQSLNLESTSATNRIHPITKSFTDLDLNRQFLVGALTTPTPTSPSYKQLGESSANTTPGYSPSELSFTRKNSGEAPPQKLHSPNYENILTTISITYKSPPRSVSVSPMKSPVYENVILNPEKVDIPTSTASLPIQEASQPDLCDDQIDLNSYLTVQKSSSSNDRPKSLSALEEYSSTDSTLKANSSGAICNTSEQLSLTMSLTDQRTVSSNQSSESNIPFTASYSSAPPYNYMENSERLSHTDLSLSEVVQSSTENLTSRTSVSTPLSPSKNSPNVSPTTTDSRNFSNENLPLNKDQELWSVPRPNSLNLIDFSPQQEAPNSPSRSLSQNDKRKSDETESYDENAIYQQVKYFRRSIHEVNALLELELAKKSSETKLTAMENLKSEEEEQHFDSLEHSSSHAYENVELKNARHDSTTSCGVSESFSKSEDAEELKPDEEEEERVHVKDLKSRFEEGVKPKEHANQPKSNSSKDSSATSNSISSLKTSSDSSKSPQPKIGSDSAKSSSPILNPEKPVSPSILKARRDEPKEDGDSDSKKAIEDSTTNSVSSTNSMNKLKVFYEKDGLPPCLRARNLKYQFKTRSLDEEEFEKECGLAKGGQRRQSFDENIGYKTNSLPKTLNQPKSLPTVDDSQLESLHLSHSSEKINLTSNSNLSEEEKEQQKRERIEKYKEERRRVLSERYRSESFKEDKDVLLSRLKIYKGKEDQTDSDKSLDPHTSLRSSRRKSTKSESESMNEMKVKEGSSSSPRGEDNSPVKITTPTPARSLSSLHVASGPHRVSRADLDPPKISEERPKTPSLKVRAAIFEQQTQKAVPVTVEYGRNFKSSDKVRGDVDKLNNTRSSVEKEKSGIKAVDRISDIPGDLKDLDFIRHKRRDDDNVKEEWRRHTFDSREKDGESERLRRVSLETRNNSARKEKTSPTYCIKDMKAIFESKSKQ